MHDSYTSDMLANRLTYYHDYRIIFDEGMYYIAENFGAYRVLKKKFNTLEKAIAQVDKMRSKL